MEADQKTIEEMYKKMETDGCDTAKPLKWGFFFFSKKENNLKDVYSELIGHDYITESVHQNDEGDWVLQVSKIEVLPSAKLYRRCLAFNDLAETYDSFYDGWDVGKIDKQKLQ